MCWNLQGREGETERELPSPPLRFLQRPCSPFSPLRRCLGIHPECYWQWPLASLGRTILPPHSHLQELRRHSCPLSPVGLPRLLSKPGNPGRGRASPHGSLPAQYHSSQRAEVRPEPGSPGLQVCCIRGLCPLHLPPACPPGSLRQTSPRNWVYYWALPLGSPTRGLRGGRVLGEPGA